MKIFGSILKSEKQKDGTVIVSGYASSEAVDCDGEVIKAEAIKAAIPDYMKFANVREMHDAKKAAGNVLEMTVLDDGRTFVKTHIVDAEACKKINHKVYKGFSIGGRVTERDADNTKIIKGIRLSEISLVDRPANPEAVFTFCKVENEAKPEATVEATDPTVKNDLTVDAVSGVVDAPAEPAAEAAVEESEKADGKKDDLKKGMWGVGCFAAILSSIQDLQCSAEWEAAAEGDNSPIPAALKSWLAQGGELLKQYVAEEVAELIPQEESATITPEIISLADKAKNLMKAACSLEDADKFAKAFDDLAKPRKLEKKGSRNNASDQKNIDLIYNAAIALGANQGAEEDSEKAAGALGDLQKVAKESDAIAKVLSGIDGSDTLEKVNTLVAVSETLAKRVKELEEKPQPPKAIARVIEKGGDTPNPEKTAAQDDSKPIDGKAALKKVWGGAGKIG